MRKIVKISKGGQISIPAEIRKRWGATKVFIRDEGQRIVVTPTPEDPIEAACGAFAGRMKYSAREHKLMAREAELSAERRKLRK